MNGKQATKLRRLIYNTDYSYRYRHYMWDKPPTIKKINGENKLITGAIQADSKRKMYKQIKKFFKNGSSVKQLKVVVNELQP